MNKLMKFLGYKTFSNRWDFKEMKTDLVVISAFSIGVAIGLFINKFGG